MEWIGAWIFICCAGCGAWRVACQMRRGCACIAALNAPSQPCARLAKQGQCPHPARLTASATTASISANWSPTHLRGPPLRGAEEAREPHGAVSMAWEVQQGTIRA